MSAWRNRFLWITLALILVCVNTLIVGKEKLISSGGTLLLELAPRDPRSLLQGDYMVLRYALAARIESHTNSAKPRDGLAVVVVDADDVGRFARLHDSRQPLAENERLLHYRRRGAGVRLAGEAFFFQEEHRESYAGARYGELRVDRSGDAVLVGLRGPNLEPLGPAQQP